MKLSRAETRARDALAFALIVAALYTLFPLYMAALNSLKTKGEMFSDILAMPAAPTLANYARSFQKMKYIRSLANTCAVAAIGVGGIIAVSSMAGWALSRTKTRLSRALFSLFVFSMIVPFNAIMIPLYRIANATGLSNSVPGLGAMYVGMGAGMAIFMYHGFVKGIPFEVEEAARIDGAPAARVFWTIIFPLLSPITATIAIMNALWIWNDFLFPLIMLQSPKRYTLLLSTNMLFGQYSSDWPAILGALILAMIPIMALYAFLQRHILASIVEGAIKG